MAIIFFPRCVLQLFLRKNEQRYSAQNLATSAATQRSAALGLEPCPTEWEIFGVLVREFERDPLASFSMALAHPSGSLGFVHLGLSNHWHQGTQVL